MYMDEVGCIRMRGMYCIWMRGDNVMSRYKPKLNNSNVTALASKIDKFIILFKLISKHNTLVGIKAQYENMIKCKSIISDYRQMEEINSISLSILLTFIIHN